MERFIIHMEIKHRNGEIDINVKIENQIGETEHQLGEIHHPYGD